MTLHAAILEGLCIYCLLKNYATEIVHYALIKLLLYLILWLMFGRQKNLMMWKKISSKT